MPVVRRITLPERYAVVRHIADGGMASVWEATDTLLDRHVAVKVLSPPYNDDPDASERFQREGRAAARLSHHPNVVTVFDAGEHEDQAFLVMALYRGGTVAERIRSGSVPRAQAIAWLQAAAEALDAAHAEGVVHRDVKPGNLMLDDHDRLAVGDFGIATAAWAASVTQTGLVLGTGPYLSPEQRIGQPATPASDRYALGVVAHELLTGRRLEDGIDPSLGPAAVEVLERATAVDPDERPPLARSFVEDLAHAVGEPTSATTPVRRDAPAAGAAGAAAGAAAAGQDGAALAAAPAGTPRVRAEEPPVTSEHAAAAAPRAPLPPRRRDPAPPAPRGRPPGRRSIAPVALLAALALVVGGAAALLTGDDDPAPAGSSGGQAERTATAPSGDGTATGSSAPAQGSGDGGGSQAAGGGEPAGNGDGKGKGKGKAKGKDKGAVAPPGGTPSPAEARRLNDQGYARLRQGDAEGAIPLLERAVRGLAQTPKDLTYAFALYNLGKAYNDAGRPADAIPVLERRLEVNPDNQRGVVEAELRRAREAAGGGDGDD